MAYGRLGSWPQNRGGRIRRIDRECWASQVQPNLRAAIHNKMQDTAMRCPNCHHNNPKNAKLCTECGLPIIYPDNIVAHSTGEEGERKQVTILFSDLSGYTSMSERLDPEEIQDIMSTIFGKITEILYGYDGFIERFIGDSVMAVFGVPKAHEDDPVRAIRAAMMIHSAVEDLSQKFEMKIGCPLMMHSGINSGLVVTGKIDVQKGTHGLTGDPINLAARLEGLAKAREIIVGPETYRQTQNHFEFECLESVHIKGKSEPVEIYKFLRVKPLPNKIHRMKGMRADLIGRDKEINTMLESVERVLEGQGLIIEIVGDAGSGKSRLIQEFKNKLNLEDINWLEGHTYNYTQNTPYYPLINLLSHVFQILEVDSPEHVRLKIKNKLDYLLGSENTFEPYIGGLFSLVYPEAEYIGPEFWKLRLYSSIHYIFQAIHKQKQMVICFEDLHWADPSSIGIIESIINAFGMTSLFVCTYRPEFGKLSEKFNLDPDVKIQIIRLQDLQSKEVQEMLRSLLRSNDLPAHFVNLISSKTEGNPFYLEELVNSLIETKMLYKKNNSWNLKYPFDKHHIPSSINGVLTDRVDRLDKQSKLILQKASVIGRTFLYKVLRQITDINIPIEDYLPGLEKLDLISTLSEEPDLEYIFKHALTRDVVYNGLLKKDRQLVHEQVGLAMEKLFNDRIIELYDTLAYHFKHGQSVVKGIEYLIKAGKKSLRKYALNESNESFSDAYNLLSKESNASNEFNELIINVLNNWSYTLYFIGDFKKLNSLYSNHIELAETIENSQVKGMFYAWAGFGLRIKDEHNLSYHYLKKSLFIGRENEHIKLIGLASAWITWTCGELGLLDEAISHGRKAQQIAEMHKDDHYLHFKSLGGMAQAYIFKGELQKSFSLANDLLKYGNKHSNVRSIVLGNVFMGWSDFMAGKFVSAIQFCQNAMQHSVDPYYSMVSKLLFCYCNVQLKKVSEIEDTANEVANLCHKFGCEVWGTLAHIILGIISITKGKMTDGLNIIQIAQKKIILNNRKFFYAYSEHVVGTIYSQISRGEEKLSLGTVIKNVGFLLKNVPFAYSRAETHLKNAIELSNNIGSKCVMAQAYLELGVLHKSKHKNETARECINTSIELFKECESEAYLIQAKETLKSF
ncbi:MAG: AAA family ATPase [Desulfobacterales bacterium]|nr:AAA family ATPase [Desulfobacterales bacterium]